MQRFKRIKEYYKLLNKHRERLPSLWIELCDCPARAPAPSRSRSRSPSPCPSPRREHLASDAGSSRKPSAASAAAAAAEHLLGVPPGPAADADTERTRSVLVRPVLVGSASLAANQSSSSGVRIALPSRAAAETPTPRSPEYLSPAVSFVNLPSRSSDPMAGTPPETWVTSDPCAPTARQVARSASFEEIIGAILDDMQAILGTSTSLLITCTMHT